VVTAHGLAERVDARPQRRKSVEGVSHINHRCSSVLADDLALERFVLDQRR
jgi:hypothetical protein